MGESLHTKYITERKYFDRDFIKNEILLNGVSGLLKNFQTWLVANGHLKEVEK